MDLEETVHRCQTGEKEAFRELLGTVEKEALATAYLISGTRGIAEDIVQEAYIKCFKEIKKLRNPKTFKVWFFKILLRTGWEMSKKHSSLVPMDLEWQKEAVFFYGSDSIQDELEKYETKDLVRNAVSKLSENLKIVVILYYYNDMSIEEISKILGCFKATIKSRLFYARTVLRKELEGYFQEEDQFNKIKGKGCTKNV